MIVVALYCGRLCSCWIAVQFEGPAFHNTYWHLYVLSSIQQVSILEGLIELKTVSSWQVAPNLQRQTVVCISDININWLPFINHECSAYATEAEAVMYSRKSIQ
jgi:hypothetical protein